MGFAAATLYGPQTVALQRVLRGVRDQTVLSDLLFLERWEIAPGPGIGPALRAAQIRRANPELAAEIRAEIDRGRPLSPEERAALHASETKAARRCDA